MKFYTFVRAYNREILVRGWDDSKGGHFKEKVPYQPTLFMPSKRPSEDWQTLDGQYDADLLFDIVETLAGASDCVAAGDMNKGTYDDLEKALGFRHNPEGLLADAQLSVIGVWTKLQNVDWATQPLN